MSRQKVTPFLWFDNAAEEAATLYVSLFKNSRLGHIARYGAGGPGPAGQAMTVEFQLDGVTFIALNGGPHFKLNEAFSMSIDCHDQAEVDDLWTQLTANGGTPSQCGWLKDRFGLSWQVVPAILPKLLSDPDPEKSKRVMQAMMQMSKIDIAKLQQAADCLQH